MEPLKARSKRAQERIIEEALERFDRAQEAERSEREMALEDVRFVHDEDAQWSESAKAARQGRPVMTFDKVSGAIDQIMGDHLQNRPGIKVRATNDEHQDMAEVYTGLIRNIEQSSPAKRAYSNAFKFSITGGFGVWRIDHDYVDTHSFEQSLQINPVANPFSVYFDPGATKQTKEDGRFCFQFQDIERKEFEMLYPKATSDLSSHQLTGMNSSWFGSETRRVAEYWRKIPEKDTLYLMSDGAVYDSSAAPVLDELQEAGLTIVSQREVELDRIEHFLITGFEVLEEYACVSRYFPLVPLYGKNIVIDGKHKYRGAIRKAKDAQRAYNYERSNFIEQNALQPKQPYLATPAMLKGHENQWKNLNTSNDPVLLYNPDQGMSPQRQPPGQPSSGYLTALQLSSDDIKSGTGIYDASMGARSNETSGKAIMERDRQGDTATFEFTDELLESLEYTGRILVDMIPKIYDSQRMIRILGEDDAEKTVLINQTVRDYQTGQDVIINDTSAGQFDVVVKTGASYATKRTETAEQLSQIMAQNPELGRILADVYVKSLDLVGGEEVVKRARNMGIQEGWIEPTEEEAAEMQPDPQAEEMEKQAMELDMRQRSAEVQKLEAEVQSESARAQDYGAKAQLNEVKAQVEQLALMQMQGDQMGQQQVLQRLINTLQPPQQPMM